MFVSIGVPTRRFLVGAFAAAISGSLVCSGTAAAQSTVVLNQNGTQVTDTTLRNGSYSNTNLDAGPLITRRSNDPEWERRAILKFDTQNTLPQGAQIASATLTLTVKSGLGTAGQTRPLQAFRITSPFQEAQATWLLRQTGLVWGTPGGDIGEQVATVNAGNVPGSRISINVTTLVQRTVNGDYDSRYTRLILGDAGGDAKESYREYYASEEADAGRRPTLTIVLGSGTNPPPTNPPPTPPPNPPASTGNTLKVLQWNIAQGWGQDGKSNIDRVVNFIASKMPDVVSFNEIMHYPGSTSSQPQQIADKLRARTGKTWTYKWVQKSGAASGEGECVMTHLGVDATDDFLLTVARSVAMVRVNVNGRIVNVFSTHLDHQSSATRVAQVKQLVTYLATHAQQRIVAGDFNGWPGTAEINEMLKTHKDGWLIAKGKGAAVTFPGNPDGNTRNTRIDYVWYSTGATALATTRAEVFDTRDAAGKKISDHNPLIVTFQVN